MNNRYRSVVMRFGAGVAACWMCGPGAVLAADAFLPLQEGRDDDARKSMKAEIEAIMKLPADQVVAHPAAAFFPGAVSPDLPRVRGSVRVDPRREGWQSTGYYAAPGERVTVRIPAEWIRLGFEARIGCHKDTLWHQKIWKRPPAITRSFALSGEETRIANAFGGLIYIDTRKGADCEPANVEISGAVAAPLYVQGRTSVEEWKEAVCRPAAPWVELATDKIVITLPLAHARAIDDPVALMNTWDQVLDACADLATMPRVRRLAERIVPDIQISAGYMHSGYPVMTHADQYGILGNREKILAGQWGLFHELGHNHQNRDWTFGGTTEVTVNLFTLYVMEQVCGRPILQSRPEMQQEQRRRAIEKYAATGRSFEKWKKEPFLALTHYVQLIEAFGWDAFKKCFAQYRNLSPSERPQRDEDKRDRWLIAFSRTVGHNLGPFFEAWGIPTSAQARAEVATLPPWMPSDMPPLQAPPPPAVSQRSGAPPGLGG